MAAGPGSAAPSRGTRPRNRRELIVAAAADLFHRRGFDRVAVRDIADAVNVRPSALYRHFPSKRDLLLAAVTSVLDPLVGVVAARRQDGLDALVRDLADVAVDHREAGVLLLRESRHLAPADLAALSRALWSGVADLAEVVQRDRPGLTALQAELLAMAVLSVAASTAYHRLDPPRRAFTALLVRLATAAARAPLPPVHPGPPPARPAVRPRSRREELVAAAASLFAERGYAGTSLDDVGAAVGISGPSIYHHVEGKAELLRAALARGNESLRLQLARDLEAASDATDALHRVAASYVRFAVGSSHLVGVLIAEITALPDAEWAHFRHVQAEYVAEWTHLLREVRPELDAGTAHITVQAALTIVNDVVRAAPLRNATGVVDALDAVVDAVLSA